MLKADKNDPLKNRRLLAMLAAFNGFFVFPVLIILCSYELHISDVLCEKLLNYMAVSVLAPVIGYLYAAHKKDAKDVSNKPPA